MLLTCRQVEQLFDSFIDGELAPSQTAEVHAHLLQCPACQRQVEMMRAVGGVIGKDKSEPVLDSGFAMRVVAAMPKQQKPLKIEPIETRRVRRQRFWRMAASGSLPAAAAALFFCVLLWPSTEENARPTFVRGVVVEEEAVKEVVDPALEMLDDAKASAASLNKILTISTDGVRRDLERGLDSEVGGVGADAVAEDHAELSFMDVFLNPFDELLIPEGAETEVAEPETDDTEIVRF